MQPLKHLLISLSLGLVLALPMASHARAILLPEFGSQQIVANETRGVLIRDAIVAAATARDWKIVKEEGSVIRLKLTVRSKHVIVVDFTITDERNVRVSYVDSINMNYEVVDGVARIHPKYKTWIEDLLKSARIEAKSL